MKAYLGLGSNLGDRAAMLAQAIARLGTMGLAPRRVSHVYETEPQGRRDQPWYLNCVIEVETDAPPRRLLEAALAVEGAMGRQRLVHWGPRVIDVDVLLCGQQRVREPDFTLPHPRLHERAFALVPLVEVAPDAAVPGVGPAAPLARRLAAEAGQTVRVWGALPGWQPAPSRGPSTRAALLARLQAGRGRVLSGAALAADLGITRSAVWKHVRRLRAEGHPVRGTAGVGYHLEGPADVDPLSTAELVSRRRRVVGRVLHVLGSIDSTNRLARQMGLDGTPAGTVIVSERQTAGRGRHGRSFLSPPGGVYLSVVLRPVLPPAQASRLTLLAAVAVSGALEQAAGVRASIKWPNDVLLAGGKVAGVLLEMVAREDCVDFVVIGAGVNVRSAPAGVGATSLWAAGAQVGRAQVARAILDQLDAAYSALEGGRWAELLAAWRQRASTLGQAVRVVLPDGEVVSGQAVDVTPDGALLVETVAGVRTVYAGDVAHVRAAAEGGGGAGAGV